MRSFLQEIPAYFFRLFPERQLFYRVKGEIEFITLSSFRQFGFFFAAVALVSWITFSSMHYLAFNWMLETQKEDASKAWDAYLRTDRERTRVVAQRENLKERLRSLELTHAVLQVSQEKVLDHVAGRTDGRIDQVLRIIEMTGVNVERFLKGAKARVARAAEDATVDAALTGQGGPFVGADEEGVERRDPLRAKVAALDGRLGRWDSLENLMGALPLAAPVDAYRQTSRFGPRKDPVNKRWSQHYGLDMANVPNSPILAPAPGTVVFAGRNGRYGRFIEIDHGYGLRTRYGHLRKMLVRKGDRVQFRQQIGKLGSSGRSTGPHLHYEVLVHGKPVDPAKFIAAGKYVFKLSLAEAD